MQDEKADCAHQRRQDASDNSQGKSGRKWSVRARGRVEEWNMGRTDVGQSETDFDARSIGTRC